MNEIIKMIFDVVILPFLKYGIPIIFAIGIFAIILTLIIHKTKSR